MIKAKVLVRITFGLLVLCGPACDRRVPAASAATATTSAASPQIPTPPRLQAKLDRLAPLLRSTYSRLSVPGLGSYATACSLLIMALRPEADRWRLWQIALQVTLEPAQPAGVHDGNPASGTFVAAALAFGAALSGEDELFERYTGLVETRLATP